MTEPNGREPWVEATEYTVCVVPRRYPDWWAWAVTVTQLDNGQWRVRLPCRGATAGDHANRDDALTEARSHAPLITRNGMTAADYMARHDAEHGPLTKETP